MQSRKLTSLLLVAVLVTLSAVASAATYNKTYTSGQNKDTLSGKYEGVAKSEQIGDIPLTVEIKNDNGKITGKIETPQGPAAITGGTYENGKLTMKFDAGGNEGTVTATVDGDKITGKWELGGQGGGLELKRAVAGASAATKPVAPPAATPAVPAAGGDPISGEWDAAADVGGSSLPFTLKLKLEGDKVTGSSESAQGSAALSKGTWAANKLSFTLETGQGVINMSAVVKDGKLVGEYDVGGQMTGKWEAKKK
jgi:hypothetical protein